MKTKQISIPADLNDGQKEAFTQIIDFLTAPGDVMFLLEGLAGSGKTYLVSKIIQHIFDKHPGWEIAITAPTNKAVKVLRRSSNMRDKRLCFQTIHKLLGLKEQITNDGKQVFVKQNDNDVTIEDFNLIIVDEVSMLNDELFVDIQRYSGHIKILYMGDAAQIPPVGQTDCIPFIAEERDKYNIQRYALTEIMRQAFDNPILQAASAIREDLMSTYHSNMPTETTINEKGHGVVMINANKKEDRDKLTSLFAEKFDSPEFVANPDYAKIIAWRNVTVNSLNAIIRSIIFKMDNPSKIMEGEKLFANKPIMSDYKTIMFSTNDEFEVVSFEIISRTFATEAEAVRLSIYETKVRHIDIGGREVLRTIDILHEDSDADFNSHASFLKSEAIKNKGQNRTWQKYYDFLRKFADVGYNYAITGHKSQGSTYTNTFIIEDDIAYNRNTYEMNRILYTSYTRPTDKLYIMKRF